MRLTISDPDLARSLKVSAIDCRVTASRLATQILRHGIEQPHECIFDIAGLSGVSCCVVCGEVEP